MRTVNQLIADGFTVRPSTSAEGCTEVASQKPFWYFTTGQFEQRGRSAAEARALHGALQQAHPVSAGWRLTAAGNFAGDQGFPFTIVDQELKTQMDQTMRRFEAHHQEARDALEQFYETVRTNGRPVPDTTLNF